MTGHLENVFLVHTYHRRTVVKPEGASSNKVNRCCLFRCPNLFDVAHDKPPACGRFPGPREAEIVVDRLLTSPRLLGIKDTVNVD